MQVDRLDLFLGWWNRKSLLNRFPRDIVREGFIFSFNECWIVRLGVFRVVITSMRHNIMSQVFWIGAASAVSLPSRFAKIGCESTIGQITSHVLKPFYPFSSLLDFLCIGQVAWVKHLFNRFDFCIQNDLWACSLTLLLGWWSPQAYLLAFIYTTLGHWDATAFSFLLSLQFTIYYWSIFICVFLGSVWFHRGLSLILWSFSWHNGRGRGWLWIRVPAKNLKHAGHSVPGDGWHSKDSVLISHFPWIYCINWWN